MRPYPGKNTRLQLFGERDRLFPLKTLKLLGFYENFLDSPDLFGALGWPVQSAVILQIMASSSPSASSPHLSLQWDEFSDLVSGAPWDQACSQWSFDQLTEERRVALPILMRRFTETQQFLFTQRLPSRLPLEILWLKCRMFASLCAQVTAFYQQHHRPHLGLGPSRIHVLLPKEADPLLPARWNFSIEHLEGQELATPFTHETMPPVFQANLFQPPHSMDTSFKAPEMRDWPLGKKETFTVLLRSMEKVRKPDESIDQVQGIFHLHLMGDTLQGSSFSAQDVFGVHLPILQKGNAPVTIWATRQESPERGVLVRGQSEPMSQADWEQLELVKDTPFSQTGVTFYRAFQYSCDWYSLGLLLLQTLVGRDTETRTRLDRALPSLIRGTSLLSQHQSNPLLGKGSNPLRGLLDEQGTLFSSQRIMSPGPASSDNAPEIPSYIWQATLELALQLLAREPVKGPAGEHQEEIDDSDPSAYLRNVGHRIRQIGEWIQLELFSPYERRREILRACQAVRKEVGLTER